MADSEDTAKVPGNNNATYGPVPEKDQLFRIEFLEIAPSVVLVDQIFFLFLRGEIPRSKSKDLNLPDQLVTANLSITMSVDRLDGRLEEPKTYTAPFRTTAFHDGAHLAIRDAAGAHVNYLTSSGINDILTDCWIPGLFVKTGTWTFYIDARLGDGTCLFAMTLTQRLNGRVKE